MGGFPSGPEKDPKRRFLDIPFCLCTSSTTLYPLFPLTSLCQGASVLVPVKGEEAHGEAQGVEQLVLDGGNQSGNLLAAADDALRANVHVAGDRAVVRHLLLAVRSVRNCGSLPA